METGNMRGILGRFVASCLVSISLIGGSLSVVEPAIGAEASGIVEGTVIYQADSKRPWRYARHYVNQRRVTDRGKGELAEAVLALSGLTSKKTDRPSEPATIVVDQKDFQFIPETVVIRAGDRIKFLNNDKEVHNVQAFHLKHSFNVNLPGGGRHVETFKHAMGIWAPYRIGCVYHSAMRAWVFVLDHPYFQVTKTDGRFQLKNVPPGKYTLEMVHPAGRLRWSKTIQVEAGRTTALDIRVSPDNLPKKRAK